MNILKKIIPASFAIMSMAMVSCIKDNVFHELEQTSRGSISISVDGLLGEYEQSNDTKANLVNNIRVSWTAGDKVYVYDGASYLGELTVSLKDGRDYYAILSGDAIAEPQDGTTKITLIYSNAVKEAPKIVNGAVKLDISVQSSGTNPASIPFVAYGTLDYSSGTPQISGQIADFALATSVLRLNCIGFEPGATISSAMLRGVSNECLLNVTKDGAKLGQGAMGYISLGFTDISSSEKSAQTLYAAVAANEISCEQIMEVMQTKRHTFDFGRRTRGAGKSYNMICQQKEEGPSLYLLGLFSVADDRQVFFSRGNLTYDVLTKEWGLYENQYDCASGYDKNLISLFTWGYNATKSIDPKGKTDDNVDIEIGVLSQSQDWGSRLGDGSTFRTLTSEEWKYLINKRPDAAKLKKPGVTICGKEKCLVIAPDGFTGKIEESYDAVSWHEAESAGLVCLPATGERNYDSTINVGVEGNYWSSSSSSNSNVADYVETNHEYVGIWQNGLRHTGYGVRLIAEPKVRPAIGTIYTYAGVEGIYVGDVNGQMLLVSTKNYGSQTRYEIGTTFTRAELADLSIPDGWELPTAEDMGLLAGLGFVDNYSKACAYNSTYDIGIPYTQSVDGGLREGRLWVTGGGDDDFYWFRSDGGHGLTTSPTQMQCYCVRLVLKMHNPR